MDVVSALVAHLQTPVAVQPRKCSLDHPSVSTQPLAGLDTAPGDARGDTPLPERFAASREVVSFVGMQLLRALAWPATRLSDRRDGVHDLLQDLRVMDVGSGVSHCERDSVPVDHNVALRALFALIRRIRSGLLTPRGAATLAESKEARSQSIWSASPKRSKSL